MKKMFLLLAAVTLTFAACKNETTATNEDTTESGAEKKEMTQEEKEERNKKTVLASMEAINSHNVDAVLKDVSPDVMDYNDGSMPSMKGLDSTKAAITAWFTAFPDVKGENLKVVADGDWVMVWGDWSGTWKGDFMGQKPTGKSYKIKDVDIFKFNDEGKIVEHHFVQSMGASAQQIGMKMK